MNRIIAPIALFVYNRPRHTRKTLEALKANDLARKSKLFIFSDGHKSNKDRKKVEEVREIVDKAEGFESVEVIKREENWGLANSVIAGVSEVVERYGKVIVLEDDLITSPSFLDYMNSMLDSYKDEKKVFSISGYNHPSSLMKIPESYPYDVYFNPRASSWGWATWKDRWEKADWEVKDFDEFLKNQDLQKKFNQGGEDMAKMLIRQMNGEIDSWAIRWCYAHFKNNAYCIYPVVSYIDNIGHDGSGVHCGKARKNKFKNNNLNQKKELVLPEEIKIDEKMMVNFRKVYEKRQIKSILLDLLHKVSIF
jgi:hypothetical protein